MKTTPQVWLAIIKLLRCVTRVDGAQISGLWGCEASPGLPGGQILDKDNEFFFLSTERIPTYIHR